MAKAGSQSRRRSVGKGGGLAALSTHRLVPTGAALSPREGAGVEMTSEAWGWGIRDFPVKPVSRA